MKRKIKNEMLDQEWIALIAEAKKQGMSLEEIRQFLDKASKKLKV